jgi:hypothetical protein
MPFPFAPTTEIVAGPPTLRIDEIAACRRLKEDRSDFLQMAEVEDPILTFRVDLPITDDFFA